MSPLRRFVGAWRIQLVAAFAIGVACALASVVLFLVSETRIAGALTVLAVTLMLLGSGILSWRSIQVSRTSDRNSKRRVQSLEASLGRRGVEIARAINELDASIEIRAMRAAEQSHSPRLDEEGHGSAPPPAFGQSQEPRVAESKGSKAASGTRTNAKDSTEKEEQPMHSIIGRDAAPSPSGLARSDVIRQAFAGLGDGALSRCAVAIANPAELSVARAQYVYLTPGLQDIQVRDREVAAVFVDERAFSTGPWAGLCGGSRLGTLDETLDVLSRWRAEGAVVVGVAKGSAAGVGTNALRRLYDVRVDSSSLPELEGTESRSTILDDAVRVFKAQSIASGSVDEQRNASE